MRRVILLMMLTLAALFAIAGPASACRIAQDSYGTPALGEGDIAVCLGQDPPLDSCVIFPVTLGESLVSVTISDASGLTTAGLVGQDYNDDGFIDTSVKFCGSSPWVPVADDVPVGPAEIVVFPHVAPELPGAETACTELVTVGTSGLVTAVFC